MVSITRKRVFTLLGLAVLMATTSICLADDTRWEHGLAVQFAQSRIHVSDVTTDWASDPQFGNIKRTQTSWRAPEALDLRRAIVEAIPTAAL